MADTFLANLDQALNNCISTLDEIHSLFVVNPDSDVTCKRKITFSETIRFMIEFQSKSLPNEMISINALYDVMNNTNHDFVVQDKKKLHERKTLNTMVDRFDTCRSAIFIADCGYESFNTFVHIITKNQKNIIRIKDINSNGILSSHDLLGTEFDEYIQTRLTRRHTKKTLGNPNIYMILSPKNSLNAMILNFVSYVLQRLLENTFVLQQIFQKKNFL